MSTRKYTGSAGIVWIALCCLALLFCGCGEKAGGTRVTNIPPHTFISFGPKEEARTYFKVQAYWYGTDEDGTIARYEVATVKGLSREALDNLDRDKLEWAETARTESTFVVTADSCCSSVGTVRFGLSYWGIIVRALDNDGAVDSAGASVFFQASNVLPKAKITIPVKIPTVPCLSPPHVYIEWRGEDSDGDVSKMLFKYILIPEKELPGGKWPTPPGTASRLDSLDVVDTDPRHKPYAAPAVSYWSEWVPADCTYVKDLNLSTYAVKGEKVMAFVTCKDEGGAVLPKSLYGTYNSDNNWVRLLVITQGAGVTTNIDAGALGVRSSDDRQGYLSNVAGLFEGTPVSFKFWGSEDRSQGKLVAACRYYFDDSEDPATSTWNYWTSVDPLRERTTGVEWLVRYPSDGKPFIPSLGTHNFVVELRDLNRDTSHCEFRLEVLKGPRGKEKFIYLVDDDHAKWLGNPYLYYERASDSLWADILKGYNWQEFDTGSDYKNEVPIRRVADASTVIWLADQDTESPDIHLTEVCFNRGNYLNSYVKVGGNIIVIGLDPIYSCMFWPDKTPPRGTRGSQTSLDFTPRVNPVDSTLIYNFNWETFGIAKMLIGNPRVSFKTMYPCTTKYTAKPLDDTTQYWDPVTTDRIPGVAGWPGRVDNAFYITELRYDDSIDVRPIYSVVPVNDKGQRIGDPECGREIMTPSGMRLQGKWIGVYVPGDSKTGRGYAAYIGIPPWFFNHDEVKTLIRNLLELFDEGKPRAF